MNGKIQIPALLAWALIVASCHPEPFVSENFDIPATLAQAQAIAAPLAENPAINSMAVLGGSFALPATLLQAGNTADALSDLTSALGRTLSYNAALGKYEFSATSSAPSTTVRFVLYTVDRDLGIVNEPLDSIGYLDLAPTATPSLMVTATIAGATQVEYEAELSGSLTVGSLEHLISGSVAGTGQTSTISLGQTFSQTQGIDLSYALTHGTVTGTLDIGFDPTTAKATTSFALTSQGTQVKIVVTGDLQSISGTITVNDQTAMTISGSAANPTFAFEDGSEISQETLNDLNALYQIPEAILQHVDALLSASYWVYGLGIFFNQ